MSDFSSKADVAIVGAGPVGLYLGGLLGSMDFSVTILERKTEIDQHSKSLGIHPVSLELFDEVGIADRFVKAGLPIRNGQAFIDQDKIGTVSFESCPKPFNYILALPQYRTEQILENWCSTLRSVNIVRGAMLDSFVETGERVITDYAFDNRLHKVSTGFLIGCDGKNSAVRKTAEISVREKPYPDTYIMGDYSDNTSFGPDAAVYLHRDGLIESFPLSDSNRRWVVKTDSYIETPTRKQLDVLIHQRLNHDLANQENHMVSSFGVQHQLANTFHDGRILLAGDSAHVVSPIGGQGMNLGWITANSLARSLLSIRENSSDLKSTLQAFSRTSRSIAKTVAKRAEINMWLGRKRKDPVVRNLITRMIVNTPLQKKMAGMFTMRDLD